MVVAQHGASLVLPPAAHNAAAIVSLGFGGKHAGSAFADVLTGAYSPSGRLVDTWYEETWDLPKIDDYDMRGGNGRTYRFYRGTPAFAFGFGLSFTTFVYSGLEVSQRVQPCSDIPVSLTVLNSGTVVADHSIQVYISAQNASDAGAPLVRLVAFAKLHELQPAQQATVHLHIQASALAEVDVLGGQTLRPGTFVVSVNGWQGPGQGRAISGMGNVLSASFELTGKEQALSTCRA